MPFSDITVITISLATFLFSILFFVTSSYTSHSVSSYHLPSSQLNTCAYCVNITVSITASLSQAFGCWLFLIGWRLVNMNTYDELHFRPI